MPDDRKPTHGSRPDATDIVTGPVGSAHLKDPATSGDIGGDVYELPGAEPPTDVPAGDPPPLPADREPQDPTDRPAGARER
jgi:hypothetical protein